MIVVWGFNYVESKKDIEGYKESKNNVLKIFL